MKGTKRPLPAAAVLSLLCAATSCLPPGLLRPRDRGGVFLLIAVESDAPQAVERTMKVMESRCDALGIYCKAEREGGADSNRFRLRVSGAKEIGPVKAVLLSGGMEMRPVVSPLSPAPIKSYHTREEAAAAAGASNDVLPFDEGAGPGAFLVVEREKVVTGDDVRSSESLQASMPQYPEDYEVTFSLKSDGAERLGRWTAGNVGRYIAIILDGKVRSAPYIKSQINDRGIIKGHFTREEAKDTALVLSTGNLPAPVEVIQEGTYNP